MTDLRWTTPEQLVARIRDIERLRNAEITGALIVGMLFGACIVLVLT